MAFQGVQPGCAFLFCPVPGVAPLLDGCPVSCPPPCAPPRARLTDTSRGPGPRGGLQHGCAGPTTASGPSRCSNTNPAPSPYRPGFVSVCIVCAVSLAMVPPCRFPPFPTGFPPGGRQNSAIRARRQLQKGVSGSAYGIRTRDLRLERAVSLAARRTRHASGQLGWLGIEDSNLGLQIQSLSSYH